MYQTYHNASRLTFAPFGSTGWTSVVDLDTRQHVYMASNPGEARVFISMQRDPELAAIMQAVDVADINERLRSELAA